MVLGGVIALIAIVPIVIGLTLISSGTGTASTNANFTPVARTPTVAAERAPTRVGGVRAQVSAPVHHAAPASAHQHHPHASAPAARRVGEPSGKRIVQAHPSGVVPDPVALLAMVRRPTTMRIAPAGRAIANVPLKTPFGSQQVLWVVKRAPGWLGVISEIAGNGRVGWIPRSAASLARTAWELRVSLSSRRLTVIDHGKVLGSYRVAIGAPSSPTPTGRFAVTDRLVTRDPAGSYGCCVVALSALAPHAIQGWDGGSRIAIHTTPGDPGLGEAITHGCMHVTMAEGRWLLYHVPLGTPTLISA